MANEKPSSNGNVEDVSALAAQRRLAEGLSRPLEADKLLPTLAESTLKSTSYKDAYLYPYNPDPLCYGNNYDTYDEMRHDDQVKATLSFKKDLVLASGWSITCESDEVKDFLEECFKEQMSVPTDNALRCPFDDALRDILSMYDYGFSVSEPLFELIDGKWRLKEIKTRPPHAFKFHLNDRGDVRALAQDQQTGEKELTYSRYIHQIYQPAFGNPYGTADLRAMHTPWKIKKFFMRMYAVYVERFANPTVIGMYPTNFGKTQIDQLIAALSSIQNNTYLAIPEGTKIDFTQPTRDSSDVYERGLNLLNLMISRAALMPDLLGMSGTKTDGGSYALGETQFEMFLATINKDKTALARSINRRIIQPLVRSNWGELPCKFEFLAYTDEDKSELCKLWIEAVNTGKFEPNDEEIEHVREITKFPKGPVTRPQPPEPNDPNDPMGRKPPFGRPENGKTKPPTPTKTKEASENATVVRFRELTAFESKVDFAALAESLDRAETVVMRPLERAGEDICNDFISQIKGNAAFFKRFNPDAINSLTAHYQRPMNIEFREYFKRLYRTAYHGAQTEILPAAKAAKFADDTNELYPDEFLAVIDAEAFKLVGDYTVRVTGKARNILMEGIKSGVGEVALVKQIRDAMTEETEKWLATVVRTKTTEMYNRGRKSYWDNDDIAKQLVEAYQFSAIMDERTSEVCAHLDGKVFEKGDFADRIVPPLHFNCRSVLVPITKFEEYRASAEPSIDHLKELGGGLIV